MKDYDENKAFKSKKIKFGAASGLVLCLFLVFAVLLNVVVATLGDKVNLKLDLTQEKVTDFSDTTIKTLQSLDKDVNVYSLVPENTGMEIAVNLEEILAKYKRLSPHIKYKVIDANKNPGFMTKYTKNASQVSAFSIVFECGDRFKIVDFGENVSYQSTNSNYIDISAAEKKFTSAILYVISNKDINVGVLEGNHGEYFYTNKFTAYEIYSEVFKKDNYTISKIDISTQDIPKDIDVLILGTPTTDYTEDEIKKIDGYLNSGKTLQVCFEFDLKRETAPNLYKFFEEEWGICFNDAVVLEGDNSKYISGYPSYVLPTLESSEVTDPLIAARQSIVAELPKAITISKKSNIETEILAQTSDKSYMKNATTETQTYAFEDGDVRGKYVISAILTNSDTNGKVSVLSGGSFLIWTQDTSCANADFYQNLMAYITDNKTQISITPKDKSDHTFTIQARRMLVLIVVFIIIIPLSIIIAGIIIWLRRRHL